MTDLPSGTVTFLFTDVEGSTRLLKALGRERYARVLADYEHLLRASFAAADGQEIDTQGDAFFVVFRSAGDAIRAAEASQRALAGHSWPEAADVRVRMGMHTGEPAIGTNRYIGLGVHRAARICAAGHGGQVLLSKTTHDLLEDEEPSSSGFRDLGRQRLKDLDRPERIYQLIIPGLPSEFPPLKTLEAQPTEATPFAGREEELAEAALSAVDAPRRRKRSGLLGAALIGVLAAAIAIPVFALGGGDSGAPVAGDVSIIPNSVAVLDPQTGGLLGDVRVGRVPGPVVAGQGAVWVGNFEDRTVSRIDTRTRKVETLGIGVRPYGLALGDGALWVATRGFSSTRAGPPQPATVKRIDVGSRGISAPVKISPGYRGVEQDPRGAPSLVGRTMALLATDGTLWIGHRPRFQVLRLDTSSNEITERLSGFDAASLAAASGAIWVANTIDSTVTRVDAKTNRTVATIAVGERPCCIVAAAGALWVIAGINAVWRIDPGSNSVEGTIEVGDHPLAIAAGPNAVWVANYGDASVSRIDANTNDVRTMKLGHRPVGIAVGDGAVWVTVD